MNFDQLLVFDLVAQHGSLSKAAKISHQAQSLISRKLAQLEQDWGDRLFHRTGRGVVLTEFGEQVYPRVKTLLQEAQRLNEAVLAASGVPSGVVHVGLVPSLAIELASALYDQVRKAAPQVHLRITDGFTAQLDTLLASGHLQAAVVSRYGASSSHDEEALGQVNSYLIGKAGSGLLSSPTVRLADLDDLPLVTSSSITGQRSVLEQFAREHRLRLNIVVEVDSLESIRALCLNGSAYTILQYGSMRREIEEGKLQAACIVDPPILRTVALSVSRSSPLTRATRLVLSHLRQLVPQALYAGQAQCPGARLPIRMPDT